VQKRHLDQLNAAIVAHCEWLESKGVTLGALPDVLTTVHLLSLMPGRVHTFRPGGYLRLLRAKHALRGRTRKRHALGMAKRSRQKKPASTHPMLIDAVTISLHALCAFRMRAGLAETRARVRARADRERFEALRVQNAHAALNAAVVKASHTDDHVSRVGKPLRELQKRLRVTMNSLERLRGDLAELQKPFVAAGLGFASPLPRQAMLARGLASHCEMLLQRIDILSAALIGPSAERPTGHLGKADARALHRLRCDLKLALAQSGAAADLRTALFPDRSPDASDPDAKRMQKDLDRKEIRRAKNRVKSS
jgi:hypothetical protein